MTPDALKQTLALAMTELSVAHHSLRTAFEEIGPGFSRNNRAMTTCLAVALQTTKLVQYHVQNAMDMWSDSQ
jgi:hypothetical protein